MSIKQNWASAPTIPSRVIRGFPRPNRSPAYQEERSRGASWIRGLLWLLVGGGLGTLIAVILFLAVGLVFLHQSDLIIPGVTVSGIDIGGLPQGEAMIRLEQQWQQQSITLNSSNQAIPVTPAALGIMLDLPATIQVAHRQGRSPVMLREWWEANQQIELSPVWRLDLAQTEQYLTDLTPEFAVAPTSADIRVMAGQVEVVPAIAGQTINIPSTVADLRQNMANVIANGTLSIALQPIQPAVTDVSDAVEQANQLLAKQITVEAYDPILDERLSWTLDRALWGQAIEFDLTADNQPKLVWELDSSHIERFLTEQAALSAPRHVNIEMLTGNVVEALSNDLPTIHTRIYHNSYPYQVQAGDTISSIAYQHGFPYPWVQNANPEIGNNLTVGQMITIPSADMLLPLPIVAHKRIVVSISEQKMWVYEDGAEKWLWEASTGIASSPTSPGIFQIQTHQENAYAENWNLWMPHFMGIYRAAPYADFMNGIHGFPSRNGAQLLWTNNLGGPVTYGCILISSENAEQLFSWAEAGVIVEIQP
ncbi:L,D-transpeptidase family protein [Anaerolineales bacterium HSG6]|nr:L,D-transpeptidase family protein [Anaerolineales bacterium HSG6]